MKVAFVYSGLIRNLKEMGEHHKEIVTGLNADVYGSFWDTTDSDEFNTLENFNKILNPVASETEILKAWEKSVLFKETQDSIDVKIPFPDACVQLAKKASIFPMWYKVWKANYLMNMIGREYDVVVRLRTDLHFTRGFHPIANDFINMPSGLIGITAGYEDTSFGPHDFLVYGNPAIMDYFSSLYLNLYHYFCSGEFTAHPENILRVHLSRKDLTMRFWGDEIRIFRTGYHNWDTGPSEEGYTMKSKDWFRTPPPELNCYHPSC